MAPRTTDQLAATADEIAKKFEDYEPKPGDKKDAAPLRGIREAFEDAAHAQQRLTDRVIFARAAGFSWNTIGIMLGTSGEAARQRYGRQP